MFSVTLIPATIFLVIYIVLALLMCYQESQKRKISFVVALAMCLVLTPFIGYVIILNRPLRSAIGCDWCGNAKNESEICGVCGKRAKKDNSDVQSHLVE